MSSAPTRAALSISPSSSITERVARPAAMARALVPKVESWTSMRSIDEYTRWKTSEVPRAAPTGTNPPERVLARVTRSGCTPSCS